MSDLQKQEILDSQSQKMGLIGLFRFILPYLSGQRARLTGLIVSLVALSVGGRLLPWLFGQAVDKGVVQNNLPLVIKIAGAYLVIELIKSLCLFLHKYLFFIIGNRALFQVRHKMMSHIQSLPMSYFDQTPSGRIVTRATNDISSLGELFTQGVIEIFSSVLILGTIVFAMLMISVKLTLITLLISPVTVVCAIYLSTKLRETQREAKAKMSTINSYVAENVTGMKIVQLFDRVSHHRFKFASLSRDYVSVQLRSMTYYALLWPLVNFSNAVSVVIAIYYGGQLLNEGALGIGSLVAFIMYTQDFNNPLKFILERYQMFQNTLSGAERVAQIMNLQSEQDGSFYSPSRVESIEIKNLWFKYREDLPWVIKDLNLSVPAGQSLGLVGRTGSGKTSVISLIQGFYPFQRGQILLNGVDVSEWQRESLRHRIGVIQQDSFLFRGTLYYNISLGRPEISEQKAREALQRIEAYSLLNRPGELMTPIEERGANLSTGERQLVAFARILAFDPDFLILDEATANIDSLSEKLIQKATLEVTKGRTSIIIAHRLSTIEQCSAIALLDQGELKEWGSHAELMSRQGMYYNLQTSHRALEINS